MPRASLRTRPPATKAPTRGGQDTGVLLPGRVRPAILAPVYPLHGGEPMPWLARGRPTPTPPLTTDALVAQALAPLAPQLAAITVLLPLAVVAQTLLPVLHRLVACCWDVPAETPPHDRPFGLLTQSLAMAQQALTTFTQSRLWWAHAPDPAQRHRTEGCWRLGTALAGLLYENDTVFDLTVTLPAVPTWNPLQEPLLAWLLAHQVHGALPTPTVTWPPGRGRRHQALGALAASLVLTQADLARLTLPVARELWAFLGGDPDPANLFRQLLGRPAVPGSLAADGPSGRTNLAAQVLTTLAQCCQDGTLRVNQVPGQIFVHNDATLVVVPTALTAVRQRLAPTGVRLPGNTLVFTALAVAGSVLGTPGQNVVKAVFPRAGTPPVTLAVLRLPHALLWGAAPPPPYGGPIRLDLPDEAVSEPIPAPTLVAAP